MDRSWIDGISEPRMPFVTLYNFSMAISKATIKNIQWEEKKKINSTWLVVLKEM